jgi:fermentation-respiration switch protein FrsA (DUF1100 family)
MKPGTNCSITRQLRRRISSSSTGAGHYDMYCKPEYVNPAIDRLVPFYAKHIGV